MKRKKFFPAHLETKFIRNKPYTSSCYETETLSMEFYQPGPAPHKEDRIPKTSSDLYQKSKTHSVVKASPHNRPQQ